jgi:hypothetical protein
MKTKQAKDFLVQQTTEQAALENVPLSDLEKKMMYFTESDASSCAKPIELNEEFEAQYDTAEYEAKISRLLHRAYNRLKEEDPKRACDWDQSIRTLRKGDHYILVFWDVKSPREHSGHSGRDSLKLLASGMLVAVVLVVWTFFAAKYNINLDSLRKYLPAPNPRLAIALYIGLALLAVGGLNLFNRVLVAWLDGKSKKDKDSG